jgi:hypothetical protein
MGTPTMQTPGIFGQELPLVFAASVGVPELCAEDEATKGLDAAGVDFRWVLARTRQQWFLQLAGMVQCALARVELCLGRADEQSCCSGCSEGSPHGEMKWSIN